MGTRRDPVKVLADVGAAVDWLRAQGAHALATDSRKLRAGDAFIAWPGYGVDARGFVPAALASGAAACLVEAEGLEGRLPAEVDGRRVAALAGLKAATGELASRFLGEPSGRLKVVAITGTNGKTSCAWWTAQALSLLGRRCGLVGTLGVGEPPSAAAPEAAVQPTGLTTPDPVTLQAAFQRFAGQGFAACAIEASSIGLAEHRLAGTRVDVAVFTNFTRDHLDYHGDMDVYWQAKSRLFDWPGLRCAVLNVDDPQGLALAGRLAEGGTKVWSFSAEPHHAAHLQARHPHYQDGGLAFTLNEGAHTVRVQSRLVGDFNVANLLAVIGALRAAGVSLVDAAAVCAQLTAVPGRMQPVPAADDDGPSVVVDYAHTPDALEKALSALRPLAEGRGGKLWAVFGCGGNRDATKRPLMGEVAERLADRVVLTSDNPRAESPAAILAQIAGGLAHADRAEVIEDRRLAIRHAVAQARPRDVVLLAGKGHEAEQEIAGAKLPFSDLLEAQGALATRIPA
jgi:UDP-N-acetylmuramyl-tripeptide synthetase